MAKRDYELDLSEVAGKSIANVYGYVSGEFGDPTFKLTRIEMSDGKIYDVEGEHDMPYLTDIDFELPDDPEEDDA